MKSRISILIAIIFIAASCKKTNNTANENYFVFGYEDAICATCNSIHPTNMAFLLKNSAVYKLNDSLIYLPGSSLNLEDSTDFTTTSAGSNAYSLSNTLMNNFPAFLLNSSDTSYGLQGSSFGNLVIAVKNNGVLRQWRLSPDTTSLPVQIRSFVAQLITTVDTLYPPYVNMNHR